MVVNIGAIVVPNDLSPGDALKMLCVTGISAKVSRSTQHAAGREARKGCAPHSIGVKYFIC